MVRWDRRVTGCRQEEEAVAEIKEFLLRRAFKGATVEEIAHWAGCKRDKIRRLMSDHGFPFIDSRPRIYFANYELLRGPK